MYMNFKKKTFLLVWCVNSSSISSMLLNRNHTSESHFLTTALADSYATSYLRVG